MTSFDINFLNEFHCLILIQLICYVMKRPSLIPYISSQDKIKGFEGGKTPSFLSFTCSAPAFVYLAHIYYTLCLYFCLIFFAYSLLLIFFLCFYISITYSRCDLLTRKYTTELLVFLVKVYESVNEKFFGPFAGENSTQLLLWSFYKTNLYSVLIFFSVSVWKS